MQEQIDEEFAGVISGYQAQILLNSQRLKIKIQSHSKDTVYESFIEYKVENPLLKEVKKSFKNLTLLFEYINQFSEDPKRIKIDLSKCEVKIVKNDGLRRLKTDPILIIPLQKRSLYEKKQKSVLENQIQKAQKRSQILKFTFTYLKGQRERILSEFKDMQDWMKQYCSKKSIEWNVKNQIQKEGNEKIQVQKIFGVQVDKMMEKNLALSQFESESLFFESKQLIREKGNQQDKAINNGFDKDSLPLDLAYIGVNSYDSYDPFSYL